MPAPGPRNYGASAGHWLPGLIHYSNTKVFAGSLAGKEKTKNAFVVRPATMKSPPEAALLASEWSHGLDRRAYLPYLNGSWLQPPA
jgi:hypothetical protein